MKSYKEVFAPVAEQLAKTFGGTPDKFTLDIQAKVASAPIYVPAENLEYIKGVHEEVRYRVYDRNKKFPSMVASFTLVEMPHCCAFMVSCGAFVVNAYQHKGVGRLLNQLRQEIAREAGYTAIICTDKKGNAPQRTILKNEGWKDLYEVVNKRTRNTVCISIKEL